jgi:hypothetical protein
MTNEQTASKQSGHATGKRWRRSQSNREVPESLLFSARKISRFEGA